ncbi:MAG: hypothetical protein M2R45_02399 [Verrucomicrobia subdivision 3 bacterium]|nr:hypothetical protein [Limisphaerales bacterium]MCS1416395.1 hypothetical protein [Limisphaerales bacterium]
MFHRYGLHLLTAALLSSGPRLSPDRGVSLYPLLKSPENLSWLEDRVRNP